MLKSMGKVPGGPVTSTFWGKAFVETDPKIKLIKMCKVTVNRFNSKCIRGDNSKRN